MSYDVSDPRSSLTASSGQPSGDEAIAVPELISFSDPERAIASGSGSLTWFARGQNFVLGHSVLAAGDVLEWEGSYGYIVISPTPENRLEVATGESTVELVGRGIVVVPPGASQVSSAQDAVVARMFDARDADAADCAGNADSYLEPHPRVALTPERPQPRELRAYALADFPPQEGRFGTIFRTNQLMVNFLDDAMGSRSTETLSPHHHDDFEQGSFTICGRWQHHIRTPWTKRLSQWRDDEHVETSGASLTIIPPPTIHTSHGVGAGPNRMIDLFAPPRQDFADKGWVVNAEDFPL